MKLAAVLLLTAMLVSVGGLSGALTTVTDPIVEAVTGTPALSAVHAVPEVYAGECSIEIEICYQDFCVRIKITFPCA